jgi:hypothetical protein
VLRIKRAAGLPDAVRDVGAKCGDREQDMEELQDIEEHVSKILPVPETFHFVTDWRFQAPLQKVWSVVLDIERYPGW